MPPRQERGVMNEFAPLIHPRGKTARYSTYILSSFGRNENKVFISLLASQNKKLTWLKK